MVHKKVNLPQKICEFCERPFCWRRKWARDWDNVRYCSQRCKRSARPANRNATDGESETAATSVGTAMYHPAHVAPHTNNVRANLCAAASVEDEF